MAPVVVAGEAVCFRQSTTKLVRVLPAAVVMAGGSGLLFLVGVRGAGLAAVLAGGLGLAVFGPALLLLLWAVVRPNYLVADTDRVRFRLYTVEATIAWAEIRAVGAGAGWPSLTFHDCERISRSVVFRGFPLLGWIVEIPTRVVSLIIRQPLANMCPTTRRQLADGFRANERMFGFHYGLPTSLLDGSSREIIAAMRRFI